MTAETHDAFRSRRPALRRSGDRFIMMMSRHREFLEKQRGFLQEKLSFVEDELKNIEAFLGKSVVEYGASEREAMPNARRSDQRTIKSYIFDYLSAQPEGLTTADMLERIHAAGRTDYDLLHLRAYLYRLGNLGFLIRKGKSWHLAAGFENNDALDSKNSLSSESEAH